LPFAAAALRNELAAALAALRASGGSGGGSAGGGSGGCSGGGSGVSSGGGGSGAAAPPPLPSAWACDTCTFINDGSGGTRACEVCGTARAGPPPRVAAPPPRAAPRRTARVCGAPIDGADVRAALAGDAAALARYNETVALAAPGAVACPTCGAPNSGLPGAPAMVCTGCGGAFCFSHGAAHAGRSCAEFDAAHAAEEKATRDALAGDKGTRACPRCKVPTSRVEGCNHSEG